MVHGDLKVRFPTKSGIRKYFPPWVGLPPGIHQAGRLFWFAADAIQEQTVRSMTPRGNWIKPAAQFRRVSGCATKGTGGSSDFSLNWVNRSGESKFVNTLLTKRIQN